jgi:toxin CcdB
MQYYIYRNGSNNKRYPYLIDVQSDLVDLLTTRIVIPLLHSSLAQGKLPERICPLVEVEGEMFIAMTHEMASVDNAILREEVGSAMPWRDEIKGAMDFIFDGF